MPELPDISAYIVALETRIVGRRLEQILLNSAFVLRTAQPPISDALTVSCGNCAGSISPTAPWC